MGAAMRAILFTLALLTISLATIPGALATEEEVQTPDGTYYVSEDHAVTPPEYDREALTYCVTDVCFILPGLEGGDADVTISLWKETNGCQGLQTSSDDCDGDGIDEPADEKVAEV